MYLKALEMQGFKSFPDKTVLNFDKGMTAVVGPNGSGKSNISDAVMWVLGEQSTKSLRSSKMEDVIFSGTEKRRAMGYAEVTLKLDNSDGALSGESKEIAVTRRYYRSGDSEYKINGKSVRLKDIHELFMDTGLGRDGYSMVGQGRIESIVSAKSTDRREIFEEAAGISHYRYRRSDALKRLDQAEENLVRLRDIESELKSRIGPLAKQSEKALEFLDLSAERKNLEIGLWLRALDRSAELLRRQTEKIDITANHYNSVEEQLGSVIEQSGEASERSREITAAIEKLQRAAAETEQRAADADSAAALIRSKIEHNNSTIERIDRDIQAEDLTHRSIDEKIDGAKEDIEKISAELDILKSKLEDAEKKSADLTSQENEIQSKLLDNAADAAAAAKELSRQKIASSSAMTAVKEINARIEVIEREYSEKQREAELRRAEEKKHSDRVTALAEKEAELRNLMSAYKIKYDLKEKKLAEAKKKADESTSRLSSLISKKNMLEETERNMDGYLGSVKAVVRRAENGGLDGIRGPVSRLVTAPGKYAVAIETALGAAVQNIVTETEEDAKQAMYFLKNTNAGRATFLPMTAIKPRYLDEKGLEGCAGFIAVASDLASYGDEYKNIVGSLLGRTVVCDTLDNAVRMAKRFSHRFKIVTVDGQVINAGGSMTGGSAIRNSGFMTRNAQIEKLAEDVSAEQKNNDALLSAAENLRADFERAKAEQDGAGAELFKIREEKLKEESLAKIAASAAEAAQNAVDAFVSERDRAFDRLSDYKENQNVFNGKIEELEEKVNSYSAEAELLGQERDSLVSERESLSAEISKINIESAEKLAEKNAKTEVIAGLERRRGGHSEKLEALRAEQDSLRKENETLELEAEQKTAEANDIREQRKMQLSSADDKVAEREECEKTVTELRQREREKNAEKENLASELVRLEEKKNALVKDRDDTERKLYEEYGLTRGQAREMNIEIENATEAGNRLAEIKRRIKALGAVNVGAVDEYKEVSERYEFLSGQIKDADGAKNELLKMIEELTGRMSEQFRERFDLINAQFSSVFADLFGGGRGELILEDETDILECGIEIKAQPPGKNVKSISLLSGGEKGLCAIALLFAILRVNPAPFCIFDEVEAALDDVNVSRFAQYVRSMTGNTQFILITHRRGSMEEADVMYGVTMQERGVSKLLELRTAETAKLIGIE